jgi:hypothetical protein
MGFTFLPSDRKELILWKIIRGNLHSRVVEEGRSVFYNCIVLRRGTELSLRS